MQKTIYIVIYKERIVHRSSNEELAKRIISMFQKYGEDAALSNSFPLEEEK